MCPGVRTDGNPEFVLHRYPSEVIVCSDGYHIWYCSSLGSVALVKWTVPRSDQLQGYECELIIHYD